MVSSLSAFARYQEKSAWLWEHQALSRARFCSGYARLEAEFEAIRERVLRQARDCQSLKTEVINMRKKCMTLILSAVHYLI